MTLAHRVKLLAAILLSLLVAVWALLAMALAQFASVRPKAAIRRLDLLCRGREWAGCCRRCR